MARIATAGGSTLLALAVTAMVGTLVWTPTLRSTGSDLGQPGDGSSPSATAPAPGSGLPTDPAAGPSVAPTSAKPTTTPTTKPAPKPTKTSTRPVVRGDSSFEGTVLTLVNQERVKAGCASLTNDSRLAKAARAHSADMAARDYFDHTTPEGVSFAQRISDAGYRYRMAAENIAAGQSSPASVMKGWMNSSGHRANILNCKLKHIGVGLAYASGGRPFWTQDFATPA